MDQHILSWVCQGVRELGSESGNAVILKECTTPAKIIERGLDGIIGIWKKHKIRAVGRERAVMLLETVNSSIGTREGMISAENELHMLLEDYESKIRQYDKTMEKMLEIKGVGLVTAAGFIAEIGDVSRFMHPKQIQKLAGLSLKENTPGSIKVKQLYASEGENGSGTI